MTGELRRPVAADAVPPAGPDVVVEATAAECAALAARMRIPAVHSLRCRFHLTPGLAGVIAARGQLDAEVVRTCVVTSEEFTSSVGEDFEILFVVAGTEAEEIDPEAVDEIPYEGGVIDLGEAAAEQLALALDPYPRAPDAALPDLGDVQDSAAHPFERLSRLRHRE